MALKYENIAKIGERIRSYDFEGRYNCYVEGVVERISDEKGFMAFVITVDVDGWPGDNGDERRTTGGRVGATTFVPMGLAWGEYNGRIVNLTADLARIGK